MDALTPISAQVTPFIRLPDYRQPRDRRLLERFVAESNYAQIYRFGYTHPRLVSQSMKWFADRLPGFIRATKGTLINPVLVEWSIFINA